MHCRNRTLVHHHEFNKYMKVKGVTSKDVFDDLFDVGGGKFLLEKGKTYLHESFEKCDPQLLQHYEHFEDLLNNDGLQDIIGDEFIQNLNIND